MILGEIMGDFVVLVLGEVVLVVSCFCQREEVNVD